MHMHNCLSILFFLFNILSCALHLRGVIFPVGLGLCFERVISVTLYGIVLFFKTVYLGVELREEGFGKESMSFVFSSIPSGMFSFV